MTKETIAQLLEAEGLSAANASQGYGIPENREATCLIAAPGDVLTVDRLLRVELRDKYIVLENSKRERYLFSYEVVLGLRLVAAPAARERVAGFSR
jgi:hypothetical protein